MIRKSSRNKMKGKLRALVSVHVTDNQFDLFINFFLGGSKSERKKLKRKPVHELVQHRLEMPFLKSKVFWFAQLAKRSETIMKRSTRLQKSRNLKKC